LRLEAIAHHPKEYGIVIGECRGLKSSIVPCFWMIAR
jgi:hypothetical protein